MCVMAENERVVQFSCPECGKRVEVKQTRSTPEFNAWIDIRTKCRRGFDELRLTQCPSFKPEYIKADRAVRGMK